MDAADAGTVPDRSGGVGDIDGDIGTVVTDPRGAVNTGRGDQFVISAAYFVDAERGGVWRRAGGRLRSVAEDHFRYLELRFEAPPGYDQARSVLAREHAVLVAGSPGSGRRAAALMLLRSQGSGGGRFHELSGGLVDGEDADAVDASQISPGDCLLLDLTGDEDDRLRQRELERSRVLSQDREAHLAVVLPDEYDTVVPDGLGPLVTGIGRPDAAGAFRRHLRAEGFEPGDSDRLPPGLAAGPMRDVGRLARLTREARDAAGGAGQLEDWLGQARAAITDRRGEVAGQVAGNPDGRYRALLLAAAVFDRAPAEAVWKATQTLLSKVRYPVDDTHRLDRPDLAEQLAAIGATTDGQGRVQFTRLDYANAVRAHFWRNFPELRNQVRDWVGEAVAALPELNGEDRDQVVTRLVERCLSIGRPDDIFALVRDWTPPTGTGKPTPTATLAARALECGLADESAGWRFRRRIYYWARDRTLQPEFAQVLIAACADAMASTHPDRALVRLHHLARNNHPAVRREAAARLCSLAGEDRRLYVELLRRLTERLASDSPLPVDLELFLALSDCDPVGNMRANRSVGHHLAQCWAAAMIRCNPETLRGPIQRWLQAVADDPDREPLLDVLVCACYGRTDLFSVLYMITRDWTLGASGPVDPRARRHAAALVEARCRAARGVVPVGAAGSGEETPT